jgi:hypothetical protein
LCLPCHLRWEASRTARNELNPGGHPKSFEEIAQKAKPANYLAIVYIDIDRLGKFMSTRSGSKAEYREWSRKITCRLETAVSAAQCAICAPSELLLMGGDEVMVAIPAGRLHAFLRAFHGVYRVEPGGEDLPRFSAGAAIANSHFPITEFRRIAYELVTSAKAIRDADSVDYEIVTTSMVGTIMEDRKRKDNRRRTAKPYKLEEWFAFCEDARNVRKGVPASQVKSLYRIANEGRLQAELEYNYLLTRVGRREGELLRKVIAPGDNSPDTRFWIPGWTPGVECTRAADLVEIQDFIDAA